MTLTNPTTLQLRHTSNDFASSQSIQNDLTEFLRFVLEWRIFVVYFTVERGSEEAVVAVLEFLERFEPG